MRFRNKFTRECRGKKKMGQPFQPSLLTCIDRARQSLDTGSVDDRPCLGQNIEFISGDITSV